MGFDSKVAAFLSAMPCLGAAVREVLLLQMWLYLDAHTRMIISSVVLRSAAWNKICVSDTWRIYN